MADFIETRKNQIQAAVVIILVIILAVIIALTWDLDSIQMVILSSGWIGLVVCVGLYGLLGFTPIPSEPLTVFISTIYGPFTATLVSGSGNLLAALMEYYVGRHLGNFSNFEQRRKHLPFGLGRVPVESPVFLIVARMLPGYGPKFVSILGGVYHVPLYRYIWTAAIPTFLGSAIFAYGGYSLLQNYL